MQVVVRQARDDGESLEIELPGCGAGEPPHIGVGADRHELVTGNSDRLSVRKPVINRHDFRVVIDRVGSDGLTSLSRRGGLVSGEDGSQGDDEGEHGGRASHVGPPLRVRRIATARRCAQ